MKVKSKKEIQISSREHVEEQKLNVFVSKFDEFLPSTDYGVYPIVFKKNWDYPKDDIISLELFSNEECDDILSKWENMSSTIREKFGPYDDLVEYDEIDRKCDIKWVHYYFKDWEWVFDRITSIAKEVNDCHYKFELSDPITLESLQFTRYNTGGFYKWHTDWKGGTVYDNRKISFTIELSDPETYEGGGLMLSGNKKAPTQRGLIHFFPSFVRHKADNIIKGTRFSMVGWIPGYYFK